MHKKCVLWENAEINEVSCKNMRNMFNSKIFDSALN